MAYPKFLSSADILKSAVELVEHGDTDDLSLRAIASALGVKAPSLYRYFSSKQVLEIAVAEEIMGMMLAVLQPAKAIAAPHKRFREIVKAYLHFAHDRFPLYSFVMQNRHPDLYWSRQGKAVWNILLDTVSEVSGQPDDTAAAVAAWSFLHGYAALRHSGAFGSSGPKGGLERGVKAFLESFDHHAKARKGDRPPGTTARR